MGAMSEGLKLGDINVNLKCESVCREGETVLPSANK